MSFKPGRATSYKRVGFPFAVWAALGIATSVFAQTPPLTVVNDIANGGLAPQPDPALLATDVDLILARAVALLTNPRIAEAGIIAVTDREGHVLGVLRMTPSGTDIRISEQAIQKARTAGFFQSDFGAFTTLTAGFIVQEHFPPGFGNLEGGPLYGVPFSSFPKGAALNSYTGGFDGQLQVPRFIVFVNNVNTGGSDPDGINPERPADDSQSLVITPVTDDLGGVPLFKLGGLPKGRLGAIKPHRRGVGGVGVEIDGFGTLADYGTDLSPGIIDEGVNRLAPGGSRRALEEATAFFAQVPFKPPGGVQATRVLVNGFRFPYAFRAGAGVRVRQADIDAVLLAGVGTFGTLEDYLDTDGGERDPNGTQVPVGAITEVVGGGGATRDTPEQEFPRQGWVPRYLPVDSTFPATADGGLTTADVNLIVGQAAAVAERTRAAIRRPIGQPMRIFISVVDLAGNVLGGFRTNDATVFSFDVSIQKGRTAAFFSTDQVGFSARAIGFMSQVMFPPGLGRNPTGPLSGLLGPGGGIDPATLDADGVTGDLTQGSGLLKEISHLLNDEAVGFAPADLDDAVQILSRRMVHIRDGRLSPLQLCMTVALTLDARGVGAVATTVPNGITIFPGGVPLYKVNPNTGQTVLVGGLGISGDGVDQDDAAAFGGSLGFRPGPGVLCDEASPPAIQAALLNAVTKLRNEFPNLGQGDGVLDVLEARILSGNILQGLRLPYIKLPRSPGR
ncbi:MAG: hypothetical protein HS116_16455 [Planctomycetes bacterium]|nr:hypothetical protein [Planctomycetota bacterium]